MEDALTGGEPSGDTRPQGHDQLFKDLIQAFPADFLRLMASGIASRIDAASLELQPAEGFLDLPRGQVRRFDLVARVKTRSGRQAVLLHVEIELRYRSRTASRFWTYNRALHLRHGLPVHTFAVYLRGGPPGARTSVHREVSLGQEVSRFRYRTLGLSRAPAERFLRRPQPLAWALASLMWSKDRRRQRTACLRRIAAARRLDPARRALLFNCVATYLELEGGALDELQRLLAESGNEEARATMMTWAEKLAAAAAERGWQQGIEKGFQEGIEKGKEEGMREIVLRLLKQRFRRVPAAVRRRVDAIASTEELASLAERVLTARSLEELGLS